MSAPLLYLIMLTLSGTVSGVQGPMPAEECQSELREWRARQELLVSSKDFDPGEGADQMVKNARMLCKGFRSFPPKPGDPLT